MWILLHKAIRQYDRATGRIVDELRLVNSAVSPIRGTFIDVGAHYGSSSLPFAARGWRVVAFEPDPSNIPRLRRRLSNYENVEIVEAALSDRADTDLAFYRSPLSSGISSLAPFHGSHREATRISTTTLTEVLATVGVERVDVLKVDTEGADLPVLRGFPWDRMSPSVVVSEFEDLKTRYFGYGFKELAQFLVEQNYTVLVSEWYPVAEYGGRHRWRRLSLYPCEIDPLAWGNLIATATPEMASVIAGRFPG